MVEAVETIAPVPLSPAVVSVPDPEIEEEEPVTVALPMNRRLALAEIEDEEPVIAPVPENLSKPLAAIVLGVEAIAAVPINRNAPLAEMVDGVDARDPLPVKDAPPSCASSRLILVGRHFSPIYRDGCRPCSGCWDGDAANYKTFVLRQHKRMLTIGDLGLP